MSTTRDVEYPRPAGTKQRRPLAIVAVAVAGLALLVIMAGGIGQNLVYYWGPTELRAAGIQAQGATIRLGGLVAPGSVRHTSESSLLEFDVTDATAVVHVRSMGAPPQMFREGIGVVVEGTMTRDGYFESTRLMVKHGNDYQAPKEGASVDAATLMKSTDGLQSQGKP
jgi:cytochrome c-type biogenesis protein CcmE